LGLHEEGRSKLTFDILDYLEYMVAASALIDMLHAGKSVRHELPLANFG
jgi:hypothetical protein